MHVRERENWLLFSYSLPILFQFLILRFIIFFGILVHSLVYSRARLGGKMSKENNCPHPILVPTEHHNQKQCTSCKRVASEPTFARERQRYSHVKGEAKPFAAKK
jgi:hypothetical protein